MGFEKLFTPQRAVAVLTVINLLNYVDRGIIAGAGTSIRGCVNSTAECTWLTNVTDFDCESCLVCGTSCNGKLVNQTGFGINEQQLGYLQSSFMLGYTIAAVAFGHLTHYFRPYTLMFVGLAAWVLSAAASSFSGFACDYTEATASGKFCDTFYSLLLARVLSGTGEASVATLAVPFMDDVLDQGSKGFYFALYFAAVPVGTALGFVYAGVVTSLTGRWEWTFFGELWPMIPLALVVLFVPDRVVAERREQLRTMNAHDQEATASGEEDRGAECEALDSQLEEPLIGRSHEPELSFVQDLMACLGNPLFVFTSLGFAQFTAVTAGLAFYGPKFVQSYRPGDPHWNYTQVQADIVFGALVAFSGLVGTTIGGIVMDRQLEGVEESRRCTVGARLATLEAAAGFVLLMMLPFISSPHWFFFVFVVSITIVFACNTTGTMVTLYSVPPSSRAMSMALSILILHTLGDVPSPIVIGYISDHASPQVTLFLTLLWFSGTIVFWGIAWYIAKKQFEHQRRNGVMVTEHFEDE